MTANDEAQVYPPTAMPAPDLKGLDRLVGTWKVLDPTDPNGVAGQVRYEWMEGGFFLLQHVDLISGGRPIKGLEIIGHERAFGAEPSADIKSRFYGVDGDTLDYVYEADDLTLTIWGGMKGSPAYFRGTWSADGNTLDGAWVYPGGGGYSSTMTRVHER